MNSRPSPALLVQILDYLEKVHVTLTDLICFILVSRQANSDHLLIYRDLIQNTRTILSAFFYHPTTAPLTRLWAHDAMRTVYANAVSSLARMDQNWHFVASQAQPEQVRDFRIKEMASGMEQRAPVLWSLVQSLLGGVEAGDSHSAATMELEGDTESEDDGDSDEEYWEQVDDIVDGPLFGLEPAKNSSTGSLGRKGPLAKRKGRRVSRYTINRIKTVFVLSILMQNRDQMSNGLQSIIGIFLHACNAPEKVIKTLSRLGVSISLSTIHRGIHSLSAKVRLDAEQLGQTLLASYAFDNFELQLPTCIPTVDKPGDGLIHLTSGVLIRLEHGVTLDDLRYSQLLWERSPLNTRASDPRYFDASKTLRFLYTLHQEPEVAPGSLTRRGRFRAWLLQTLLFEYGPGYFKTTSMHRTLQEPESIDVIPVTKAHYVPLRTMDLNQSKVSDNISAIQNMFAQAGVGGPSEGRDIAAGLEDISEFVTLVHGDLGTYERVLSARRRRSVEAQPYDRLQSVEFVIGLFHLKMAAADAIWRLLVAPDGARRDETSFMHLVGRLRPRESSRLVSNAKFRQQHELIRHVLTVLVLDAWRTEVVKRKKVSSLEEWVEIKPTSDDIADIARTLVQDYVEGEELDLYDLEGKHDTERDQIRENNMRMLHYLLLYEELSYAMNAGDIGRVETVLVPWIQIFRATGKHKYGTHTLRFMHALYFIYPERLRRAVRYNMLVNLTGKPHEFRAVDWLVELLNLYTKVIYGGEGSNYTKARIILESVLVMIYRSSHANLERNLCLPGLSRAHAKKDMRETFAAVWHILQALQPNGYIAGRKASYVIPNAVVRGASIIVGEGAGKEDGLVGQGIGVKETEDALEELDVELTAEDLSVECMI